MLLKTLIKITNRFKKPKVQAMVVDDTVNPITLLTPIEPSKAAQRGRAGIDEYYSDSHLTKILDEIKLTSKHLEKIPTYGPEERLVAFHIKGVPVLGELAGVERFGFKYHNLEKIPPFQQHLPFIVTMYTDTNETFKFYALEKEDMHVIGDGLLNNDDVLWVGVYHREQWLQFWNYAIGAIAPPNTIDFWYPGATEEEIEASRF